MSQYHWTQLPGRDSAVSPCLTHTGDRRLVLVVVSPAGEVSFTTAPRLGTSWDPWMSVVAEGALKARPDTAPVFVHVGGHPHVICRGADDELHVSRYVAGATWEPWRRLTTTADVLGKVSAVVTRAGGESIHVVHQAAGATVRYRRFDASWRASGAPVDWPGAVDGEIGSDRAAGVLILLRTPDDRLVAHRSLAPWHAWSEVGQRPRCLTLSNCVHYAGAFHVAYVQDVLRDELDGGPFRVLAHTRFRDEAVDDGYYRVVQRYQERRRSNATLAVYRNKLVAAYIGDGLAVSAAYWDTADARTPWVELGAVASGRSTNPVTLVALDSRATQTDAELLGDRYGDDLHASVTGGTVGGIWVCNLSRAFLRNRVVDVGTAVDWCMNYRGPKAMDQCTPSGALSGALPAVADLPVFSEVGYGTMAYPDWLVRAVVARTQAYHHDPGPYVTWIHPQAFQGGVRGWLGPHINLNHLGDHIDWVHEMAHRTLTTVGIWNAGASPANPNLMNDLIPPAVTAGANALFREGTGTKECPGGAAASGRCRGFCTNDPYERDTQHAFTYVLEEYLRDGDGLRDLVWDDLRAGSDLLQRKYDWVRHHVFGGAEFSRSAAPLTLVTLTNLHSGKALDVVGRDLGDHAGLQQYAPHAGDNQRWTLLTDQEGRAQLKARHSGKCLDVAYSGTEDGARVQLYTGHGRANQLWRLVDGHGAVEIVAEHSGKCLEVAGWSTADRAVVQQYSRHGGANQKWRVDVVSPF